MQERAGVWIRVAGHAMNIRTNQPFHWRCFVNRERPEVPLANFVVLGEINERNFRTGTDPTGSNALGLVAWLDFFGDIVVNDNVATITLQPAP